VHRSPTVHRDIELMFTAASKLIYIRISACYTDVTYCNSRPAICFLRNWNLSQGAITSKIKHSIKLKTIPARLAQLLQPSLAFWFSLQPMTAHWTVRRHWLQATTKCQWGLQQLCNSCASLAGLVLSFIVCFILLVIAPLRILTGLLSGTSDAVIKLLALILAPKTSTLALIHMVRVLLLCDSFSHGVDVFFDPVTGPQWPRTLFLFLCLFLGLLSDVQCTKALSFLNRSLWNFSHVSTTIFCSGLPWRIFDLGPD